MNETGQPHDLPPKADENPVNPDLNLEDGKTSDFDETTPEFGDADGTEASRIADAMNAATVAAHAPLLQPVMFGFVLLAVVFVAYQLLGGLITFLLFGFGSDEHVQGMRLVTMLSQAAFLLLPAVILLRLQGWDYRKVLRLRMPRLLPLLLVVVGVVSLQFVVQAYMELQQHVLRQYILPESVLPLLDKFEELIQEMYGTLLAMHSPIEALFVWLVIAVTPGICEEVLFRGSVQWSFEKGMRLRWAMLLNGAIFSMFHLNPITFIPLAMLGTYFAVITWRGGSLGYSVAGHIVNNSIAVIALYVFESESLLPTEGAGTTPSAIALVVSGIVALAVFLASLSYFWKLTAQRDTNLSHVS